MLLIYFSFALNGCTSNQTVLQYDNGYNAGHDDGYSDGYDDGYSEGYDDGYNYCWDIGSNQENFEEEYLEFGSTIIALMYDYEYETVEKLFEYCPEAIETFLEYEFGTANIPAIIDDLESERTLYPDTIVGKCKYCGEDVCHKDAIHWMNIYDQNDRGCAHQNCYAENNPD